jgi:acetyl-CoA carboxylase carboxyl transferase subunit alpha
MADVIDEVDESVTAPDQPVTAWDRVKIARHPKRPHSLDYFSELTTDFIELHGDRSFGDDQALIGGLARFRGRPVMLIGHQKGADTKENLRRNFGMSRPEGYRKADRLMRHAAKFRMPVLTFIDTSGADPTLGSEERGQAIAIAESLATMASLRTPIVAIVIGEGGSGGALAIGVADRILMLENSVYSVASPEGSASILWKDASKAPEAAERMRITAADLKAFGIIDEIVPEPTPAHEQPKETIQRAGDAIDRHLAELLAEFPLDDEQASARLVEARYAKFRAIGSWRDQSAEP